MNNFSLTEINEKISERSKFVADLKKNMENRRLGSWYQNIICFFFGFFHI